MSRQPRLFLHRLPQVVLALLLACIILAQPVAAPKAAPAEEDPRKEYREFQAIITGERAKLLQTSVDSLALSLGGIFRTLPDDKARRAAMATALNTLTFEQGGKAYYTAWDGTRMIHSPLTPDLENTDFSLIRDENGQPFVKEMERMAARGGGFLTVTLPRRRPVCTLQRLAYPAFRFGNEPSLSLPPPSELIRTDNVRQILYVRGIAGSDWHLAAFMPQRLEDREGREAPLRTEEARHQGNAGSGDRHDALVLGLILTSAAVAGLAGICLRALWIRRRKQG